MLSAITNENALSNHVARQPWYVNLSDEKTAIFMDLFHSFSCLWEVTSKEYHRREIRQAAMQSTVASVPQEEEVSMTGECFKIRSGELPYLSPMFL